MMKILQKNSRNYKIKTTLLCLIRIKIENNKRLYNKKIMGKMKNNSKSKTK